MKEWPLHQARNAFNELINAALTSGPQLITRRGRPAVVVVSAEEYKRLPRSEKANTPAFIDLLLEIPQDGEEFERMPLTPRPFNFCKPEDAREN